MKKLLILLPFLLLLTIARGDLKPATDESQPEAGVPPKVLADIPGWGTPTNPDGDCKFFVSEGALSIVVPGANGPHDLAAELDKTNAPRVLQSIKGDFTLQVQVEGRFTPGDESTLSGRTGYNGAGLVVVLDPRNVVTLARAVLQRPGGKEIPYANFEMRKDGKLQRIGHTGDHPLPKEGPVFLRLERRGQQILGAVSADGTQWDHLAPKEIPAEWTGELQVGVIAISSSKEEFNPRFTGLQLLK